MKKSMTHKAAALRIGAFAIGSLFLAPLPAMAGPTGAMVYGGGTCVVSTIGGPIASAISVEQISEQITTMQSSISSTLNRMGAALDSAQNSTASVIESEFKNQNNVLRQYAINARAGQIKAQTAIDEAPAQQAQNSCDSPGLAAGIQVGAQTNRDLTGRLTQSALAHDTGFSRSTDATAAVLAAPDAAFGPPAIFPQAGSMTPAQFGVARQWLSVTTAPSPLPALPAGETQTASGERYAAAVRVDAARLAVPQETLAEIASMHAASIATGTWTSDTWAAMTDNSKAPPSGVVDGKISDAALTNLMVDSRYANPSWYAGIATKNQVGLLREIALLDAVRAHIEVTQLRLTERIASMLAQTTSEKANEAERRAAGTGQ